MWREGPKKIEDAFLRYYDGLLGTESDAENHVSDTIIAEGALVSEAQQIDLCVPFTVADVKAALFDIDHNKSAGPD